MTPSSVYKAMNVTHNAETCGIRIFTDGGKTTKKVIPNFKKTQKRPLLFTADLEQKCKATA